MKKRLAAFFAAVFLLFSLSETVEASASTYRNQLSRTECELYDAMVSYLPQGYDSFRCELSQPAIYATVEEANSSLQMQVSRAYEAFYRDYPEVFWLDKSGISFSAQYDTSSGSIRIWGFSLQVSSLHRPISRKNPPWNRPSALFCRALPALITIRYVTFTIRL